MNDDEKRKQFMKASGGRDLDNQDLDIPGAKKENPTHPLVILLFVILAILGGSVITYLAIQFVNWILP